MTDKTERTYLGDIIREELPNFQSRKLVTIAQSAVLKAGAILGVGALGAATAVAFAGNTAGAGTVGAITVADGAMPGVYKVVMIEPGANAGKFTVEDPNGVNVGTGTVAVAFTGGGLTFTISDATDFVAGDGFNITVAAGSGKYKIAPVTAADGTDAGAAILLQDVDASAGDVANVSVFFREGQVSVGALIYDASADDDNKKAALRAGLEAKHVQFLRAC